MTALKKKESSYQKMKRQYDDRIRSLTNDIVTLVEKEGTIEAAQVKLIWKAKMQMDRVIWQGESTSNGNGFFKLITDNAIKDNNQNY